MAYVRQRGKQLMIVHGEREPGTGKVEQKILFTIYSRAEARELLDGKGGGRHRFQSLMESSHPGLRFDWKTIRANIAERLEALPEGYEYRALRLLGQFHRQMGAFTRQLALSDPTWNFSAAQVLQEHRHQLTFLKNLLDWRLAQCHQEGTEGNRDDPFHWSFTLSDREVPCDVEEMAEALICEGKLEEAEAVFRLFVDSFDDYADGYNHLGWIALKRDQPDEAIRSFELAMAVGRKKFLRQIQDKDAWGGLDARPYVRAMSNLCRALGRAGRHGEALQVCDRLEEECGEADTALAFRAVHHLSCGDWVDAFTTADRSHPSQPEQNFIAAFAAFEMGRLDEVVWRYLHAALVDPVEVYGLFGRCPPWTRAARIPYRERAREFFLDDLAPFLRRQSAPSRRFFSRLLRSPWFEALLREKAVAMGRWSGPPDPEAEWKAAFARMHLMETPEFARTQVEQRIKGQGNTNGRSQAGRIGAPIDGGVRAEW